MRKLLTLLAISVAAISLFGCAAHPNDIPPAAVAAITYESLPCEQLAIELANAQNNLRDASNRQKRKRNIDGWSNALILPGVASIAKDSSEAVALHKGEIQTITRELAKRCRK